MSLNSRLDPLRNAFLITPSDSDEFHETRSLYLAVSGDVNVLFSDDTDPVLLVSLPAGWHPLSVIKVLDTDTDADLGLVGAY